MDVICRIQDLEGRGPYRPGFSSTWSERDYGPLPIYLAFPDVMRKAREMVGKRGGAVGCGFRSIEQAGAWFSPSEVLTLAKHGYSLCWMKADEVLAENNDQLVFWSAIPLADAVLRTGWTEAA